jgi:glycosyltransferase involved in cell wall biosynthesis
MKIGMMVDSYKPYISGITNYVEANKEHLENMGHEVFVFTFGDLDYKDNEKNIIRSPGVPLADSGFYLSLRYKRYAWKLLQSMDVVHVHHPFLSGRLALRYCRPMNIPIIFTNHTRYDLYAQAYLPLMPDEVSHGLLQAYMPSFCKAVDSVITPSAGMEKVLRELDVKEPIAIIPNGVDLSDFKSAAAFPRSKLGYKKNDVLLIYAGRIAVEKNLPFLIEAFIGVAKAIPNVHLLLIGGGVKQYQEEIHTLIRGLNFSHRIKAIGKVPYSQLPQYLAMGDIFVTASVTEVHPLSVIEAMGAGLPIMGIESVGVGDIVKDGVTGFLSSEDLPAFTAKLTRLCLDPPLRAKMSISARRASAAYDITRTTKMIVEHYQTVIKKKKKKKINWSVKLQRLLQEFIS